MDLSAMMALLQLQMSLLTLELDESNHGGDIQAILDYNVSIIPLVNVVNLIFLSI